MVRGAGKSLVLAVLLGFVSGLAGVASGQDVKSALLPAKGRKCDIYLKSGEIKKGKVKAVGDDYITVEVKLSPFYAEPQTFRLTQVSRVDYGDGVVDVAELLSKNREQRVEQAAASILSEPQAQPSAPAPKQTVRTKTTEPKVSTSASTSARSGSQPEDETVRRLMAILRSLDEGEEAPPKKQKTRKVTQPRSATPAVTPSATVPKATTKTVDRGAEQAVETKTTQPVVVPVRKVVAPTRQAAPSQSARQAKPASSGSSKPRKDVSPKASKTTTSPPAPKPTVPALKPQKSHLAQGVKRSLAPSVARNSKRPTKVVQPKQEKARTDSGLRLASKDSLAPASHASSGAQRATATPEIRTLVNRFYKAAMILAGAVVALALGVVFLAVTVWRRRGSEEVSGLPAPAAESGPGPQESAPAEPPVRVVMVKGDYAVIDRGLDHGLRVGDLLLLKRPVPDGEYELGLARVLKVFDRLSGIKVVEKFVETELRVGDVGYKHQPSEPESLGEAAPTVRRVEDVSATTLKPAANGPRVELSQPDDDFDDPLDHRYLPSQGRWRHR